MKTNKKIALVTGATRGIGKATTELLLEKGFDILAVYKSDDIQAKYLKDVYKDRISCTKIDISTIEGLKKIKAEIKNLGQIDVLINNAGITFEREISDSSFTDWAKIINTNIKAPFFITKFAIPYLQQSHGVVINVCSRVGFEKFASASFSLYSLSKAALINFTMSSSRELNKRGIRVNAVIPPVTETDIFRNTFSEEDKSFFINTGKLGKPSEIASLILQVIEDKKANGVILVDSRAKS